MTPMFWIFWLVGLLVSTWLGAFIVKKLRVSGLFILGTMLAIYVVGANVLVPRLIELNIFGLSFIVVTGAMIWPFTAQLTDMINEIYGRKAAYLAAFMAYVSNIMLVLFLQMSFQTPTIGDPAGEVWFRSFFGVAGRVLIASMCSYTVANWADITIFSKIKEAFRNMEDNPLNILLFSSVRSAVSDGLNMVIDSAIFYTIAFIGTMPTEALLGLIGSSMLAKVIISQIDLPFYWLFRMMTRGVERSV